jgi:hypothetical protein
MLRKWKGYETSEELGEREDEGQGGVLWWLQRRWWCGRHVWLVLWIGNIDMIMLEDLPELVCCGGVVGWCSFNGPQPCNWWWWFRKEHQPRCCPRLGHIRSAYHIVTEFPSSELAYARWGWEQKFWRVRWVSWSFIATGSVVPKTLVKSSAYYLLCVFGHYKHVTAL